MIGPLPQLPLQALTAETPGVQPDPRVGGDDSFAQILAAAAIRVPPLAGPPPMPDHGPAIVALPSAPEAIEPVAMTDPAIAAGHEAESVRTTAEVFNQQGFFGNATPGGVEREIGLRGASMPQPLQAYEVDAVEIEKGRFAGVLPAASGAPVAVFETSAAKSLPEPQAIVPRQAPNAAVIQTRLSQAEAPEHPDLVGPAPRRAFARTLAARSPVAVALRELETGLHVAVRADALDEPERVRLQDEIAALLARHGRPARSIRISAPIAPAPLQEKLR